MEIICENLPYCGFIKKHGEANNLAIQGFVSLYCKGPRLIDCKRLEYIENNGAPPPEDMMPNGANIVKH
jgi:hypothetical protein